MYLYGNHARFEKYLTERRRHKCLEVLVLSLWYSFTGGDWLSLIKHLISCNVCGNYHIQIYESTDSYRSTKHFFCRKFRRNLVTALLYRCFRADREKSWQVKVPLIQSIKINLNNLFPFVHQRTPTAAQKISQIRIREEQRRRNELCKINNRLFNPNCTNNDIKTCNEYDKGKCVNKTNYPWWNIWP